MDRIDTKPDNGRYRTDDDELDADREAGPPDWIVGGGTPPGLQTPLVDGPDGGAAVGTEPELQERPLPGPGRSPGRRRRPGRIERAARRVNRPLRIAQVAPPMERVPPRAYGGTERVIFELVTELDRRGHEVTTFASADSDVPGRLIPTVPEALRPGRLSR